LSIGRLAGSVPGIVPARAETLDAHDIVRQCAYRLGPERAAERCCRARCEPCLELIIAQPGNLRRELQGVLIEQLRLLDVRIEWGL
jgi:hypothetical protein